LGIKENELLTDISQVNIKTHNTFAEVMDEIGQAVLKNYCREYAVHPVTTDFEKEIRRRNGDRPTYPESKIYPLILTLYVVVRNLKPDSLPHFDTEELFFTEPNWMSNHAFVLDFLLWSFG
jgi:hypothetical protein